MDAKQMPSIPPAPPRPRIYSHITRSRFLHLEDSLSLASPKIRIYAGEFRRGQGSNCNAFHFLDVDDARWIFADMAWGKAVDHIDFKGTRSGGGVISRVLKINTSEGKYWFELKNGTGEKIGEGAVKPVGDPDADVSVGLTVQEGRRLAFAALAYIQAWDVARMIRGDNW